MASGADASRRLAILELTKDGPRKKCVSLAANTNLSIFVLAEGPHERFLIYDLLRDNLNLIILIIVGVNALGSRCTTTALVIL